MPHEIISKINADISRLESRMHSLEAEDGNDPLKKFELAQVYFELGALHEAKEDNDSAASYFNDSRIEFDELLQICDNDPVFIKQHKTLLEYLGEKIPEKYKDILQPKNNGFKDKFKNFFRESAPVGKLTRTIEDALHSSREYEESLQKATKLKDTYLKEKSLRLKKKIAEALYLGLMISVNDDYGKNAVEHHSGGKPINIELPNATEQIRHMVNSFWGGLITVKSGIFSKIDMMEKEAETGDEKMYCELLRRMAETKYGPKSIKTKMKTSEVGTSMDRRRYYFMMGATRKLIGEDVDVKLNYLYKRYGKGYNVLKAWNILSEKYPAFQKLNELGISNLIEAYDSMSKKDRKFLKHDIKETIAQITEESVGNEFEEKINQGISKVTTYVLKAGKKLDELTNGAKKLLS